MDRKQILRMTKPQLVEFALEWSTWIGPRDIPLTKWSKDELVNLCLETLDRPPLTEDQRAGIKASREPRASLDQFLDDDAIDEGNYASSNEWTGRA